MSVTYSNQRLVGVRPAEYMYSRLGVFHNTNIVEHADTPVWYSYTSTFSTWEEYEGGISDYTNIQNKPQINSVTLSGDKDGSDIKVVSYDSSSTDSDFTLGNDTDGLYYKVDDTKTTVNDYSNAVHKPTINEVTVTGALTGSDIKVVSYDADSTDSDFTLGNDTNGLYYMVGTTKTPVNDYSSAVSKPTINSVTVTGSLTGSDIKVVSYDADSTSTSFTIGIDETGIYVKSGETKTYLQPVSP